MPPLVDRSQLHDTLSFDNDTSEVGNYKFIEIKDEDNRKNNSQGISELESL